MFPRRTNLGGVRDTAQSNDQGRTITSSRPAVFQCHIAVVSLSTARLYWVSRKGDYWVAALKTKSMMDTLARERSVLLRRAGRLWHVKSVSKITRSSSPDVWPLTGQSIQWDLDESDRTSIVSDWDVGMGNVKSNGLQRIVVIAGDGEANALLALLETN